MSRAARFVWVGAGGFLVQAAVLQTLVSLAGLAYPVATALAVEAAILHNFIWHERWTWGDRVTSSAGAEPTSSARRRLRRFLRFNGSTALISIAGNVVLMFLLVGALHLPLLLAMAAAVTTLSVVNFACADRFVFTE